uniref:Uncharacterized protein n=1 Tax=Haptolina ericina TaxID=156174 RepID=A0A7S3AWK6_9EUKA
MGKGGGGYNSWSGGSTRHSAARCHSAARRHSAARVDAWHVKVLSAGQRNETHASQGTRTEERPSRTEEAFRFGSRGSTQGRDALPPPSLGSQCNCTTAQA